MHSLLWYKPGRYRAQERAALDLQDANLQKSKALVIELDSVWIGQIANYMCLGLPVLEA